MIHILKSKLHAQTTLSETYELTIECTEWLFFKRTYIAYLIKHFTLNNSGDKCITYYFTRFPAYIEYNLDVQNEYKYLTLKYKSEVWDETQRDSI